MSITLVHDFHSAEELASVLNSIGPPLTDMQAARTTDPHDPDGPTTNAIDGTLVLPNGFESFADAALVEAVGGQPFGEEIAASGLTPEQAMSFTFRVSLPGELVSSETGTEVGDGVIEWKAPLDGTLGAAADPDRAAPSRFGQQLGTAAVERSPSCCSSCGSCSRWRSSCSSPSPAAASAAAANAPCATCARSRLRLDRHLCSDGQASAMFGSPSR